jgi:hypothetical protein
MFFARLASKFSKSANMTLKIISADFKSVEKVLKCTKKGYKQNKFYEPE